MLFNSWQFLLFFPIVTTGYFVLPHAYRTIWLLAASCLFYMSFIPGYLLILLALILVDYTAAFYIERSIGRKRFLYLVISIVSTCLVLFTFKYFNFFNANFAALAHMLHWNYSIPALKLILPIGLSFHTFQSMSYVIEVYRGEQKVERNFWVYSLYVMFYPQLVAGPIERPQNLLHQFHERHHFTYRNAVDGLILMAWGLFKKVLIADRLAFFVNAAYGNPINYGSRSLILATVFFALQVYCDFSGYSDIAKGAAQVMGFNLMQNFDRPYSATSLSEFWKRWHISLSTWLRDYLYTPLSLQARDWGNAGIIFALMTTFLISGLWHGANWTFVFWGVLHGVGLSLEVVFRPVKKKLASWLPPVVIGALGWLITFSYVCFTFVFFRAVTIDDAFLIIKRISAGVHDLHGLFVETPHQVYQMISKGHGMILGQSIHEFNVALIAIATMEIIHFLQKSRSLPALTSSSPALVRWTFYYAFAFGMIHYGIWFQPRSFIYFQF